MKAAFVFCNLLYRRAKNQFSIEVKSKEAIGINHCKIKGSKTI